MRRLILCLLLVVPSLVLAKDPLNVVLIISDDQAWTDYGFMGHEVIKTPHLDRLASQSLLFTRGYVTTSLCRPSLATLATGLYPHQHGITGNDPAIPKGFRGRLRQNPQYLDLCEQVIEKIDRVPTLPRMLWSKGYRSHQSGKWWEGHYSRGGFTEGMTHGDPSRGGRHGDRGLEVGRRGLKEVTDFIDRSIAAKKPYFVWYAPFLPHTPHNPPKRLLEKYKAKGRPQRLAKYYAMCEWFDETCGALVEHVDKTSQKNNTLIVYVTDNGWIQRTPVSNVPKGWNQGFAPRSKQSPNDGGLRTPIFFRLPGKIQPKRDDTTLVSSLDIVPTILAACGLEVPESLPGIDILATDRPKRDRIFGEVFAHDIANLSRPADSLLYRWCIEGNYKLITTENGKIGRYTKVHPRTDRRPQLYDLSKDPHENKNLAGEDKERVDAMMKALNGWWRG
ncbi:MAG: sulfatase [Planctomycetota bacterium]